MCLPRIFIILCLALSLLSLEAYAGRSVYQKQLGTREIEVEFDSYYSNIDFYQPLTAKPIAFLEEDNEFKIYQHLLLSPVPRYLVLELSANPLPWFGVFVKKNEPDIYNRSRVDDNLNLVQALCAGFEEPYACSLFLGNVVSFRPRKREDCDGKGYIGVLISGGNYHIKDSELIEDDWREGEIKFKGDRIAPDKKISWSFRMGIKTHRNQYIKDVYYFAIRRDRIDFFDNTLSALKNSGIEYTADIDRSSGKIIRHYFRIGKKLAVKRFKFALSMNTGFIWEGADKYTGPLARSRNDNVQVLLQPNIEF